MVIRERAPLFLRLPAELRQDSGVPCRARAAVATNLKAYSEYFSLYVR